MNLSRDYVNKVVSRALDEDLIDNDVTTRATVGDDTIVGTATLLAKSPGIIAGIGIAAATFEMVDPNAEIVEHMDDGARVEGGETIASIRGSVEPILGAERTALNFIQRMSGIATLVGQYVDEVRGTGATIVDTRKTAPGLRLLDKYCVAVGGGSNHRLNLSDGILIKDNHIAAMRSKGMSITDIVRRAAKLAPHTVKLEIEASDIDEAKEAIDSGADIVMLDNMSLDAMRKVVATNGNRSVLEASGGITLSNVRDVAETGVDLISIGALTHSPPALDISLELSVE